jgi:EpsI family protein
MSPANPERRGRSFTGGWLSLAVPVFLAVQVLVVHAAGGLEHPPQPPSVASFPAAAGQWKVLRQDPIDLDITTLKANALVSQTYIERSTNSSASLLVAWYQTQRDGAPQPHSPKFCLPGWGWRPEVADYVSVDTAGPAITVNRYIVVKGAQRAVVLYWYQTPWRVIASEWAEKFWVAADALRSKRTDTALVRVVVWSTTGRDDSATAVATGFTRDLYPALRNYLPQ